jgi:hypothetical protein
LCRLIKIFDEYTVNKNFKINYQLIVKLLMYIMLKIRSNIIYFIFVINYYIFNFIQTHWQTIKRIFRYLRKTHQMKLMFREILKSLKNYTNSNWTENLNIKRSISEYWKEIMWNNEFAIIETTVDKWNVRMMILKQSKKRRTLFRKRKFDVLIRSI